MTTKLSGFRLARNLEPGSSEWWTRMSASKVAAALGLSPWESRFSLWHKMAGTVENPPPTIEQSRGHYLEPAIRSWFADQHPEWVVSSSGTWQNMRRPWQIASPDGEIWRPEASELRLLECKTDAHPDGGEDPEWGEEGTDQIPVGYRAQVMWTMDTIGATVAHVACLGAYLQFREYIVYYDPDEAAEIRELVAEFMDTLPTGKHPRRPDIDGHTATYEAVRALNPLIVDDLVELSAETATRYLNALDAEKAIKAEKSLSTALVADEMGECKYGTYLGVRIARREQRAGGNPFVKQTGHRPPNQEATAA
ncbi:YqaJ viral recombinase family protein [Nocardia otitidiscaviarum]|uniref:YqaJ viral recombinase family protein n=1 Tax=Nocardia otitidiscaviarum TaxID=1823 RepID=UPI0024589EEB|nr:YqaJ viral recombinase family protein [Nocardia otitidiscaviarum]